MEATKYFTEDMTAAEARTVFFQKFHAAQSVDEIDELKAAYNAVAAVILHQELVEAAQGWLD